MDTHKFFVEKLRFHLNEPDMLVFVGWFYDGKASGREVQAYLDGEKLPAALTVNKGAEVRQKYLGTINEINEEVVGIVTLPKDWREKKKFEIFTDDGESKKRAYAVSTGKLRVRESRLEYYIENIINVQRIFLQVVSDIRKRNMFTFPVLSISLLT